LPIPIAWDGIRFDEGFRTDLVIDNCVTANVSLAAKIAPVMRAIRQTATHGWMLE